MHGKIGNLSDLFEHELMDIYDAESKLADALKKQAAESTDPQIRVAFTMHQKETERQRERIEKVFSALGKKASRGEGCAGIDGLLEEHKKFKRHQPTPEILDIFNIGAGQKIERYEITAYTGLITLAQQLGFDQAIDLLQQNLEEEEATLEKLATLGEEVTQMERVERTA